MLAKAVARHTTGRLCGIRFAYNWSRLFVIEQRRSFVWLDRSSFRSTSAKVLAWSEMCFVWPKVGDRSRLYFLSITVLVENSPAIIFIDEIDAIATKRFDAQTGGSISTFLRAPFLTLSFVQLADREVQRILLELLNQMDGFDQSVNVKVSYPWLELWYLCIDDRCVCSGDHGHESCRHSRSRSPPAGSFGS